MKRYSNVENNRSNNRRGFLYKTLLRSLAQRSNIQASNSIAMASTLLIQLIALVALFGIAHSAGLYEQCAGEGYGTFPCTFGLTCFRRNKWFSSCQHSCPLNLGWECEAYVVRPPVSTIAAGWDQCGGEGWLGATVCAAGFACYARSIHYAQVRHPSIFVCLFILLSFQCRPVNDCPAGMHSYKME